MRLTLCLYLQTERSKEMNLAAVDTSPLYFQRKTANLKPNTYLNSAKEEDSKYLGFGMLKSKEDEVVIFHLHFFQLSFHIS